MKLHVIMFILVFLSFNSKVFGAMEEGKNGYANTWVYELNIKYDPSTRKFFSVELLNAANHTISFPSQNEIEIKHPNDGYLGNVFDFPDEYNKGKDPKKYPKYIEQGVVWSQHDARKVVVANRTGSNVNIETGISYLKLPRFQTQRFFVRNEWNLDNRCIFEKESTNPYFEFTAASTEAIYKGISCNSYKYALLKNYGWDHFYEAEYPDGEHPSYTHSNNPEMSHIKRRFRFNLDELDTSRYGEYTGVFSSTAVQHHIHSKSQSLVIYNVKLEIVPSLTELYTSSEHIDFSVERTNHFTSGVGKVDFGVRGFFETHDKLLLSFESEEGKRLCSGNFCLKSIDGEKIIPYRLELVNSESGTTHSISNSLDRVLLFAGTREKAANQIFGEIRFNFKERNINSGTYKDVINITAEIPLD